MTLAEKYGIKKSELNSIQLSEVQIKYDGTLSEVYNLIVDGKVKVLKEGNNVVGVSVSGYDTVEEDSLASYAFAKAYYNPLGTSLIKFALDLVESNLVPTKIVDAGADTTVTILGGLKTLDIYGNEVEPKVEEPEPEAEEVVGDEPDGVTEEDLYIVPGNVAEGSIKNYIRKTGGRCFARGCQITFDRNDVGDYEVRGIQYGRKLSQAERDLIDVEYED